MDSCFQRHLHAYTNVGSFDYDDVRQLTRVHKRFSLISLSCVHSAIHCPTTR